MLKPLFRLLQPITLVCLLLGVQFPVASYPDSWKIRANGVKHRQLNQGQCGECGKDGKVILSPLSPLSSSSPPHLLAQASPSVCPANLGTAIEEIIGRPEFKRSRWGILIRTLNQKRTLYSLDANNYFLPASNAKLLTTAAALYQLGSQFRLRTSAYGTGRLPNLTSLRIVGYSDPSLDTDELKNLAYQLKRRGVRRISELIIQDSYLATGGINPTWEWSDVFEYYAVAVNSLNLNENAVILKIFPQKLGQAVKLDWSDPIAARQWQVENQAVTAPEGTSYSIAIDRFLGKPRLIVKGKLAIDSQPDIWGLAVVDPGKYILDSFRPILNSQGIIVSRGFVSNNPQQTQLGQELAAIESPTLEILLRKTNQDSNNLFAEALAQILAKKLNTEKGVDAVKQSLTELGVDPDTFILADGSGLSRHNLVSPEAIVQTLKLMAGTPEAKIYRDSLAIAGVKGTLRRRFKNTPLQGKLKAKTGTITGVSTLSGYLNPPAYQPLVFSIMINQSDQSTATQRQTIDEIVLLLNSLRTC